MAFHSDSSSIKRYIIDCYPQFIAPIEEIEWKYWEENDRIPDGKIVIRLSFVLLSRSFSNLENGYSLQEVDFFRDIEQIFLEADEDEDRSYLSSDKLLEHFQNSLDRNRHLYEEISLPYAIQDLDEYDNAYGTNFGQLARTMFIRFATAYVKADGRVSNRKLVGLEKLRKLFYPAESISDAETTKETQLFKNNEKEKSHSLYELLTELNSLVGLDNVKKDVQEMVNFLKIQQLRVSKGMNSAPTSKHLVFYGNPGTGKTTIARQLSKIYRALGVISKGHLVEIDRAGLVAGYVGQTALKVHEVVSRALGGILFIDEAYTLNGEGQDFGSEAIDTLLKLMEDNRDDLIVIVAGYTEKMSKFLETNPGLKSRFNKFLSFEDYYPEQLQKIFTLLCENDSFKLTIEAEQKLLEIFKFLYEAKDETFGNARLARNLFEHTINNQANRIITLADITDEQLSTIEVVDIPRMLQK